MRAALLGSDGNQLCQLNALREGFASLGHQHTFDYVHPDTSFVFCGNPPFEPYLELAKSRAKKVIFNVLDCPTHCREWPEFKVKWAEQLQLCDKVTTISKTTQARLKEYCGIDSEVIYYPMKAVKHTGVVKYPGIKALCVGRVNDSNKRVAVAIHALIRAGFNEDEVAIVGPENPRYGRYFGVVSDETLNDLYNSTDYVMMPSLNEGIGLPAVEAAVCGAIPMICPDLSTFQELWVESPLGLHYQTINSPHDMGRLIRDIESKPDWKAQIKQDMLVHAHQFFKPKLDRAAVAGRIIDVFHSI